LHSSNIENYASPYFAAVPFQLRKPIGFYRSAMVYWDIRWLADGFRYGNQLRMVQVLLVALGGAIGSVFRYYVGVWSVRLAGPAFPWGTLTVNVVGSFVIGVFAELISRKFGASTDLRLLLMTGLVGGFTTFSAFSLDTIGLLESGEAMAAIVYVVASVVVSLMTVFAGLTVVRVLV
jgi:CrcB protein